MKITLRPATPDDEPLLLQAYASTRTEELDRTPWNEDQRQAFVRMQFNAQRLHYQGNFPDAQHLIIVAEDHPVGRLYIARTDQEIRILDITILPEHRSAGIGTLVLKDILQESQVTAKPVHIYVESFNVSLSLFERLGFVKSGESGYSYLMEWRARTP